MKEMGMTDVGTRLEHMTDLYEMWSEGLLILENSEKRYSTPLGAAQLQELRHALQLLWFHMAKDYNQYAYSIEIARLPKAMAIIGGRGAPLRYHSVEDIINDNDIT